MYFIAWETTSLMESGDRTWMTQCWSRTCFFVIRQKKEHVSLSPFNLYIDRIYMAGIIICFLVYLRRGYGCIHKHKRANR